MRPSSHPAGPAGISAATERVAVNLVGLVYIAGEQGRRDEALAMLSEATAIAEAEDAQVILRDLEEARATL
jgi:hypothetical protein